MNKYIIYITYILTQFHNYFHLYFIIFNGER